MIVYNNVFSCGEVVTILTRVWLLRAIIFVSFQLTTLKRTSAMRTRQLDKKTAIQSASWVRIDIKMVINLKQ